MANDPFAQFKAMQREGWALFSPLATFTTPPAAALVEFAGVSAGQNVLDVACGTGVVAVTAARRGATVSGLDLSPVLLDDAHRNASVIGATIDFREGDVENLPYADASFDVVLSQFGHMFAPRPAVAIAEMLRVLKPGGRIAFSTWPPELMLGRVFALTGKYLPPPTGIAPPPQWGDPNIVRERLGDAVRDIEFTRDDMVVPALSPAHYRVQMELTAGPIIKLIQTLEGEPQKLAQFRAELEAIAAQYFAHNRVRQSFLITRAIKR
ncbi:class I SAM-dependent methyltransferase [Fontimonas sp. SYSU GA230001]|uniref:class I SAM-dependent methyltransferase n=1 Tax=Fontimonas sp. SYSU GA230001 TaxID=3142450 RepID=UPI0032B3B596